MFRNWKIFARNWRKRTKYVLTFSTIFSQFFFLQRLKFKLSLISIHVSTDDTPIRDSTPKPALGDGKKTDGSQQKLVTSTPRSTSSMVLRKEVKVVFDGADLSNLTKPFSIKLAPVDNALSPDSNKKIAKRRQTMLL